MNPLSSLWNGAKFLVSRPQAPGPTRPLVGPNGQPVPPVPGLPHVYTFGAILNIASKTYSQRWDEAYARRRENALAMRRDCFLQGMLRERQMPVEEMGWHLEPPSKNDAMQRTVAEKLTEAAKAIPNLQDLLRSLLEALWFGRAGVQVCWDRRPVNNTPLWYPVAHHPVNGDKIQHKWDGTPMIRVYAGQTELEEQGAEVEYATDFGRALVLSSQKWRERFLIHHHDCVDSDFFSPEEAGAVNGLGIRHWIYWKWDLKTEFESWISDYMERVGLGLTVYFYEHGNSESKDRAIRAAKDQSSNTAIVWPRSTQGGDVGSGIERVETSVVGVEALRMMIEYFDQQIERFIIGQTLSSDTEGSGLGGTGVADLHADTKNRIIRSDAQRLAGTLTTDLLAPMQRYNWPWATWQTRWVFDVEKPDPAQWLEAAKTFVDLGGEIAEDEARGVLGFRKPEPGEKVLGRQAMPAGSGRTGAANPDGAGDRDDPEDDDHFPFDRGGRPIHYAWLDDKGRYHGQHPPGPGWISVGRGPHGGLIWEPRAKQARRQERQGLVRPEAEGRISGAHPPAAREVAPLLRDVREKVRSSGSRQDRKEEVEGRIQNIDIDAYRRESGNRAAADMTRRSAGADANASIFFDWQLAGGKRRYAGGVEGLSALAEFVEESAEGYKALETFCASRTSDDPAGLENDLCHLLMEEDGLLPDTARTGAEQLLYLVLCRPDKATKLLPAKDASEDVIDQPPSLLQRSPGIIQAWEKLDQSRREREYLLLHLHGLLRDPAVPDRNERLAAALSLLLEWPA
jgi:hypothetical protein